MAVDPGDWTVSARLAQLDPQFAHLLEIQHFKPISPDAVAETDVAKAVLENYVSSIVSLALAAKAMETVANVPGNFRHTIGGLSASAGSQL